MAKIFSLMRLSLFPGAMSTALGAVFAARLGFAFAAFASAALLGRMLSPAGYGQFERANALLLLLAGLAGPALDLALVQHTAHSDGDERDRAAWLASALWLKGILGVLFVAAGWYAAPLWTGLPLGLARMACAGAAGLMMFDLARAWLQSRQRFAFYALLEGASGFLRLAGLALLALTVTQAGPRTAFAIWAGVPVVLALCAWPALKTGWRSLALPSRARPAMLARTAGWALWACAATSLLQSLDLLMLGWGDEDAASVGCYGAGRRLALFADLLAGSLFAILMPRANAITDRREQSRFLRTHSLRALLVGVIALPAATLGEPVLRLVFGAEYTGGAYAFALLLAGTLLSLPAAAGGATLYAIRAGWAVAVIETIKAVALLAIGSWSLHHGGITGLAASVMLIKTGGAACTFALANIMLLRREANG